MFPLPKGESFGGPAFYLLLSTLMVESFVALKTFLLFFDYLGKNSLGAGFRLKLFSDCVPKSKHLSSPKLPWHVF